MRKRVTSHAHSRHGADVATTMLRHHDQEERQLDWFETLGFEESSIDESVCT